MVARVQVDLEALGKIVKDRRIEWNWSTAKLSSVSGVSATRINQLENNSPTEYTGKIRRPKEETVVKIARALKLSEEHLLTLAGYNVSTEPTKHQLPPTLNKSRFASMEEKYESLPEEQQAEMEQILKLVDEELERRSQRTRHTK